MPYKHDIVFSCPSSSIPYLPLPVIHSLIHSFTMFNYQIHQKILGWVRPSPLSGNARILEISIPATYPLSTGRLVSRRKDEGDAGQDTWDWFFL